jgi:FkbM family methyltransferase
MLSTHDLKYLARSRSWRFMLDAKEQHGPARDTGGSSLARLTWNEHPVYYRPGTSDCSVIYEVLLRTGNKAEYAVPAALEPRTILDIGGNIGASSLYFARLFPKAVIHVFEPVPTNFEILARNISPYSQIAGHPVALGDADGELTIYASDNDANLGGFSFFEQGVDTSRRAIVPVRHAQQYLNEQGIGAPDIIKIDTEGAEYRILTSLSPDLLSRVQWIVGELHGEKDFELLGYLSQWFDIAMQKAMRNRLFTFSACNKSRGALLQDSKSTSH